MAVRRLECHKSASFTITTFREPVYVQALFSRLSVERFDGGIVVGGEGCNSDPGIMASVAPHIGEEHHHRSVLNTRLHLGFERMADRAEARMPLSSLFSTIGGGANPTLSETEELRSRLLTPLNPEGRAGRPPRRSVRRDCRLARASLPARLGPDARGIPPRASARWLAGLFDAPPTPMNAT